MAFNVTEFRSNLLGDGARPNLFQVSMNFPAFANAAVAGQKTTFLAKAAQLPGSSLGMVPMYYFGRELKLAGNRNFADWTITVINDEDFIIRNGFESWMNGINSHAGNLRNPAAANMLGYSVDANVLQYGKAGAVLKNYKFVGLYPVDLTPIDLDWGSQDQIEEYSVTFAFQWWEDVAAASSTGSTT
jgi:hypothetical protein